MVPCRKKREQGMESHLQAELSVDIWKLNLPKTSVFTGKEETNVQGLREFFFCVVFGRCWGIVADFRAPDQCNGDKDPHPAIPSVVKLRETKQGQGGGEFISGFVQVSPNCLCFHFLLCTSRAVPPTPHSELINSC